MAFMSFIDRLRFLVFGDLSALIEESGLGPMTRDIGRVKKVVIRHDREIKQMKTENELKLDQIRDRITATASNMLQSFNTLKEAYEDGKEDLTDEFAGLEESVNALATVGERMKEVADNLSQGQEPEQDPSNRQPNIVNPGNVTPLAGTGITNPIENESGEIVAGGEGMPPLSDQAQPGTFGGNPGTVAEEVTSPQSGVTDMEFAQQNSNQPVSEQGQLDETKVSDNNQSGAASDASDIERAFEQGISEAKTPESQTGDAGNSNPQSSPDDFNRSF